MLQTGSKSECTAIVLFFRVLRGKKKNFILFITQLSLKNSQEVLLLLDACFDQIKRLKQNVNDVKRRKGNFFLKKRTRKCKMSKAEKSQRVFWY